MEFICVTRCKGSIDQELEVANCLRSLSFSIALEIEANFLEASRTPTFGFSGVVAENTG